MTENKRFTLKESDIYNRNDVIHDNGIEMPQSTVCDLLNSLNEENVKLQSRNKYLATKIQRERNSTQKQYAKWEKEAETKIKELSEENEQLKKALMELKEIGDYQEGRIKELSDENEQLKFDKTNLHRAMSRDRVKYNQFKDKVFCCIDTKIKLLKDCHMTNEAKILEDLQKEIGELV